MLQSRRNRRSIRTNTFCGCIVSVHRPLCRPVDRVTRRPSHRRRLVADRRRRRRTRATASTGSPIAPDDRCLSPPIYSTQSVFFRVSPYATTSTITAVHPDRSIDNHPRRRAHAAVLTKPPIHSNEYILRVHHQPDRRRRAADRALTIGARRHRTIYSTHTIHFCACMFMTVCSHT